MSVGKSEAEARDFIALLGHEAEIDKNSQVKISFLTSVDESDLQEKPLLIIPRKPSRIFLP